MNDFNLSDSSKAVKAFIVSLGLHEDDGVLPTPAETQKYAFHLAHHFNVPENVAHESLAFLTILPLEVYELVLGAFTGTEEVSEEEAESDEDGQSENYAAPEWHQSAPQEPRSEEALRAEAEEAEPEAEDEPSVTEEPTDEPGAEEEPDAVDEALEEPTEEAAEDESSGEEPTDEPTQEPSDETPEEPTEESGSEEDQE